MLCIPSPYFRPDFTLGVIHYGLPQTQAPRLAPAAAPTPRPLSPLELEADRLAMEREIDRHERLRCAGTRADDEPDSRCTQGPAGRAGSVPRRLAGVGGALVAGSTAPPRVCGRAGEGGSGRQVDSGCGVYLGALNETQIALPPAPDYQLVDLRQAIYDSRTACTASPRNAAAVKANAAAMRDAVRVTDEWASGRGAYYASTKP